MIEETRKKRKKQTAEVFTPPILVNEILDSFSQDYWAEDKTFLDPACGDGNFLSEILVRKLNWGNNPLEALKTIYGIDIMSDNIRECRKRLLKVISKYTDLKCDHVKVVLKNIVFINQETYPNGSLDYDFSFNRICSSDEVNLWFTAIKNEFLDDMHYPVFEDNFEEKDIDIFKIK